MLLEPHFGQLIGISFLSDRRIEIFSLIINHPALMQRQTTPQGYIIQEECLPL